MSGWVANDSYRTMQAKREAVEQARTISKIDSTMKNVQVRYVPELGVMSIKGNANDVKAVENALEKFTSESTANDLEAVEKALEKFMSESNGK